MPPAAVAPAAALLDWAALQGIQAGPGCLALQGRGVDARDGGPGGSCARAGNPQMVGVIGCGAYRPRRAACGCPTFAATTFRRSGRHCVTSGRALASPQQAWPRQSPPTASASVSKELRKAYGRAGGARESARAVLAHTHSAAGVTWRLPAGPYPHLPIPYSPIHQQPCVFLHTDIDFNWQSNRSGGAGASRLEGAVHLLASVSPSKSARYGSNIGNF